MEKAPDAFRTISEVAEDLDVPQHVLRFWESRFREIKPLKRGGGRRYYRPDDVGLLRGIRHLLYGEGYTIRGVQRILREQGVRFVQNVWQPGAPQPAHAPSEDAADEAAEHPTESGGGRGIFGRLPSLRSGDENDGPERAVAPHAPLEAPRLAAEDAQKLAAVLQELGECRKLLDVVLNEKS